MPSKGGVFLFKIRAKRQQILQLVLKKEAVFIFVKVEGISCYGKSMTSPSTSKRCAAECFPI